MGSSRTAADGKYSIQRWDRRSRSFQGQQLEHRLLRFYLAYARAILTKEWVRILVFSGLSDGYVPDRYMALLKERLFAPIWREVRHALGIANGNMPTERELELMWGMHGGIFYIGVRHWRSS